MLERIRFASSYIYSPRGRSAVSVRSRLLCNALKRADRRFFPCYGARVRQLIVDHPALDELICRDAMLVPVPGRRPRPASDTVAEQLVQALLEAGVGARTWRGLKRVETVAKSATARSSQRPSVAMHYRSFRIEVTPDIEPFGVPLHIVLVDDVITKGRTLLAAAHRVHEALPTAHISAFALLRTMGRVQDVDSLVAPCCGEIRWVDGDALREP